MRKEYTLAYWKEIRRTGGWPLVRWCLNCHFGPQKWKTALHHWWWDMKFKRQLRRMTPEERADLLAMLREFA